MGSWSWVIAFCLEVPLVLPIPYGSHNYCLYTYSLSSFYVVRRIESTLFCSVLFVLKYTATVALTCKQKYFSPWLKNYHEHSKWCTSFQGLYKPSHLPFITPLAIFVGKELCGEFEEKPVTSDSDFDLLADDSLNGFTRLFIASKEDALEKILKMGQS